MPCVFLWCLDDDSNINPYATFPSSAEQPHQTTTGQYQHDRRSPEDDIVAVEKEQAQREVTTFKS